MLPIRRPQDIWRRSPASVPTFHVQLTSSVGARHLEIERAIEAFAAVADAGLIVLPGPAPVGSSQPDHCSAAQHQLPAVYPYRY